MKYYEYKSIKVKGKFRYDDDVTRMDKLINDLAKKGWELDIVTPLANRLMGDGGKTNGMLLTFKRDRSV